MTLEKIIEVDKRLLLDISPYIGRRIHTRGILNEIIAQDYEVNLCWNDELPLHKILRALHVLIETNYSDITVKTKLGMFNLTSLYRETEDLHPFRIVNEESPIYINVTPNIIYIHGFKIRICSDTNSVGFVFSLCSLINILRKIRRRLKTFPVSRIVLICGGCEIHTLFLMTMLLSMGAGQLLTCS